MNRSGVWLAMLVAAAVILPRSMLIARAHSESVDDEYHLAHGMAMCQHRLEGQSLNDPPLGAAIIALPMIVSGCELKSDGHVLYGQKFSPETLLVMIAAWKAVLFLPLVGGAFWWMRKIYSAHAAWFCVAILTFEPNFAAFIPSPSLDVIAVEGIFFAALAGWRYFERPTWKRLIWMIVALAGALLMKHTAMFLPAAFVFFAIVYRRWPPWKHVLAAAPMFLLSMWALLLFDVSKPTPFKYAKNFTPIEQKIYSTRLPAGSYVGSLMAAMKHVDRGHPAYLLGEKDKFGWWYYLPVVATYKVPIAIGALGLAAVASLAFARARFAEWMTFICFAGWSAFLMNSRLSIGFRHFLPAYLFFLLLLPRVMIVVGGAVVWHALAWLCAIATAVQSMLWQPDQMSFINWPRDRVWLKINDSNLDWGQGLKQAAKWIDAHPEYRARPIYVAFFAGPGGPHVPHYIGDRAVELDPHEKPPLSGIVILSPMWVVGTYHPVNHYALLQEVGPIDVIGHSMLVYDLDRMRNWKKFARPKPATAESVQK